MPFIKGSVFSTLVFYSIFKSITMFAFIRLKSLKITALYFLMIIDFITLTLLIKFFRPKF
jgi:hypothetical protein